MKGAFAEASLLLAPLYSFLMAPFFASVLRAAVRVLSALLLVDLGLPAAAQVPAWQSAWAVASGDNTSEVRATATDAAGNVYLAGSFPGSVALGGTTLTSAGSYDVFVAKFNPVTNQFVWAQRAGGAGNDGATALAVHGACVYVGGRFASPTVRFGALVLPRTGIEPGVLAALTDALPAAAAASRSPAPTQLNPNPARGTATLHRSGGGALAPLTLTDARGCGVRRYPAPAGGDVLLDVQGLPAGLFCCAAPARPSAWWWSSTRSV